MIQMPNAVALPGMVRELLRLQRTVAIGQRTIAGLNGKRDRHRVGEFFLPLAELGSQAWIRDPADGKMMVRILRVLRTVVHPLFRSHLGQQSRHLGRRRIVRRWTEFKPFDLLRSGQPDRRRRKCHADGTVSDRRLGGVAHRIGEHRARPRTLIRASTLPRTRHRA